MISVLLADDNKLALEYLYNLTNWNNKGFETVAMSLDGEDALKKFKKYTPQLVITDVKMPIMTGIELVKEIKKIYTNTEFIFLSSYENFDYARSALDLGVHDYILKHEMDENCLNKKLDEVKERIEHRKVRLKYDTEKDILYLLNNPEGAEVDILMKSYSQYYDVILIEQDHYLPVFTKIFGSRSAEVSDKLLKQKCYELSPFILAAIKTESYQYILLCVSNDKEDGSSFCYKLKQELCHSFQTDFSIFLVSEHKKITESLSQYYSQKPMIYSKYFISTSCVVNYMLYKERKNEPIEFDRQLIDKALEKDDIDTLFMYIDRVYMKIITNMDYDGFNSITNNLILMMYEHRRLVDIKSGDEFILYISGEEADWFQVTDSITWLKKKFRKMFKIISSDKEQNFSKEVIETIHYIYDHYFETTLSVEDIASQTRLSTNRISVIFKNEVGITILQFLTNYRIKKGKEYLINRNFKISDIYIHIGYTSTQYFFRVFKKNCGMTPSEYRRSKGSNDKEGYNELNK